MPSWVVPSLAAEVMAVSVDHIQHLIKTGQIQSKSELGFQLVNIGNPIPKPTAQKPSSSAAPTELTGLEATLVAATAALPTTDINHTDDPNLNFDWRRARNQISRLRRAPTKAAA